MKTSTADVGVPLTMMGGQTVEKSGEWVWFVVMVTVLGSCVDI